MAAVSFLKTNYSINSYLTFILTQWASVTFLFVCHGCLSSWKVSCGFSGISNFLEVRSENGNHSSTKVNGECQALFECASKGEALRCAGSHGHQPSCLRSTSGSVHGLSQPSHPASRSGTSWVQLCLFLWARCPLGLQIWPYGRPWASEDIPGEPEFSPASLNVV